MADPVNSANTHIDIYHAGAAEPESLSVNQKEPGYDGVFLGEYQFNAGSNADGRVVIGNGFDSSQGESGGRVVADSIRFVRVAAWEQVIDQADSAAVATGTWTNYGGMPIDRGRLGHNHQGDGNPATKGNRSYKFTPTIPQAGYYSVYAWWPADSTNSIYVSYDVIAAQNPVTPAPLLHNQRINGGTWNFIGKWWFNAGTAGSVTIKNSGANGEVMADGIAFVRGEDGDEDGMPDDWELIHGFDPSNPVDGAADQDGDGISNADEYRYGLDHSVYQTLSLSSGDNQSGPANSVLANPLRVSITTGANPTAGAPVTFSITEGQGLLSGDGLQWSSSVSLLTDGLGAAQVHWWLV